MNNENKRGRKAKEIDRNNIFAVRLRKLIEETESKQQDVADSIGVSRQALNKWVNGETIPDIFAAAKIADYFNVSTDYMTGRTDVKSKNEDIQTACKIIGLSEGAIMNLKKTQMDERIYKFDIKSMFISHELFLVIIGKLYDYIKRYATIRCIGNIQNEIDNFFKLKEISHIDLEKQTDYIEALGIVLRCINCGTGKRYKDNVQDEITELFEYRLIKVFHLTMDVLKEYTDYDDEITKELKSDFGQKISNEIKDQEEKGNSAVANIIKKVQNELNFKYDDSEYKRFIDNISKEDTENAQHNPEEE